MSEMPERHLSTSPMTRRQFVARIGQVAGGLVLAPSVLAACGHEDSSAAESVAGPGPNGSVVIENWPYYIDTDVNGEAANGVTIRGFEQSSGIDVVYRQTIENNDVWLAAHERQLAAGIGIGVDLAVLTGWMVERLVGLGYVQELDPRLLPNATNLVPTLAHPDYDPNRKFSLPWTSGMAGLAYDPVKCDREITSINDLFDPAFAGHVSILSEMRDTLGLVMLGLGIDPATCTLDDARTAAAKLLQAKQRGQFLGVSNDDYTHALVSGDTWIGYAWSGDIASIRAQNPGLRFLVPEEGAMLYTDNMVIPVGAVNVANAHAWMNYVYQPTISAQIHAATRYIPPVAGAAEGMKALDPGLTINPLIFPTVDVQQRLHVFRSLSSQEQAAFAAVFAQVAQIV
jgi:spermidine/putrescine transport system substrate-binding protein